jgi:hypothetical protein
VLLHLRKEVKVRWCQVRTVWRMVKCVPMECSMQHAVMDWLNSQAAVWYEEGISKLVSRYDKCLNVQGDYVEK